MTRRLLGKALALSLLLVTEAIAAEPGFRYTKPLEMPALTADELLAVSLDSDVYAATRDGLPDLRIQTGQQDVSYLLRRVTTTKSETSRNSWAANNPSIKPLPDNALEITLELDKDDPQPQGIRIVSPLQNFEQRVRVFSSPDGKDWKPVGDEAILFDYSQFMDVRSDEVPFPASTDRHFRIVIDNITQELESQLVELTRRLRAGTEQHRDERLFIERRPFRINRLYFWNNIEQHQVTGDLKVSYPVTAFHSEDNAKDQQTILTFTSRREPLTSFKLVTSSNNFSRQAAVQIEETHGTETSWHTIGSATLSRLAFGKLKREDLTIDFPETRADKYRIVIENRASTPLAVTAVEAEGDQYQLVFLASPPAQADNSKVKPASYELRYGSDKAAAPDYDVAAITASLADGYQPKTVALGQQIAVASEPFAETFDVRKLLNDGRFLGVVAVILVAALAWGLLSAGRRLDNLPHDGD